VWCSYEKEEDNDDDDDERKERASDFKSKNQHNQCEFIEIRRPN